MARKVRTTPRKSPTQARSRATVDVILAATARLLVKHGFDRTSTNQIAEAAGVSIGSLYQYFPSKEALVAALMERHVEEMRALAFAQLDEVRGLPLPAAVHVMIEMMLRAHAVDPALHRVLMEQVPRTGRLGKRDDFEREILAAVTAFLASRKSELGVVDVEMAATIVVASVEAITHGAVLHRPDALLDSRLTDELTAMVVTYLTTPISARARILAAA
jgi:AcrR family transcriptional regulator